MAYNSHILLLLYNTIIQYVMPCKLNKKTRRPAAIIPIIILRDCYIQIASATNSLIIRLLLLLL